MNTKQIFLLILGALTINSLFLRNIANETPYQKGYQYCISYYHTLASNDWQQPVSAESRVATHIRCK